jgi:hypothetical protein
MKKLKHPGVTFLAFLCLGFSNFCTHPTNSRSKIEYEATTPCNESVKQMLKIPAAFKCEMIQWKLALQEDSKSFELTYEYGEPKQGTRGFSDDSKNMKLKGAWTKENGSYENNEAVIYRLEDDASKFSLSFLKPGENILHLLDNNKRLAIGNAAWSYTLNRIVPDKAVVSEPNPIKLYIKGDTAIAGTFEGRIPCNRAVREMNGISADGCNLVKCQLKLFRDTTTHTPANFILHTIYVGKGDTKYTTTGIWSSETGLSSNPSAVIYRLLPDSGKLKGSLLLLKADDNILFFLDENGSLLSGDNYVSYTLNRADE